MEVREADEREEEKGAEHQDIRIEWKAIE